MSTTDSSNTTHTPQRPAPIPDSYWLPGGHICAGEYPGARHDDEAMEKITALLGAGISTFVNLTAPEDRMRPYDGLLRAEAARRELDVSYDSVPVPDMGVPTHRVMNEILDLVDRHVSAGRRVYVHCWGGVGRTGIVVGCHLVRHGATGTAALRTVESLFATMSHEKVRAHGGRSPQTDEQRALVSGWNQHDRRERGERA